MSDFYTEALLRMFLFYCLPYVPTFYPPAKADGTFIFFVKVSFILIRSLGGSG